MVGRTGTKFDHECGWTLRMTLMHRRVLLFPGTYQVAYVYVSVAPCAVGGECEEHVGFQSRGGARF